MTTSEDWQKILSEHISNAVAEAKAEGIEIGHSEGWKAAMRHFRKNYEPHDSSAPINPLTGEAPCELQISELADFCTEHGFVIEGERAIDTAMRIMLKSKAPASVPSFDEIETLRYERDEYKKSAQGWMRDYDDLKAKYEPLVAITSSTHAPVMLQWDEFKAWAKKEIKEPDYYLAVKVFDWLKERMK